MKGEERMPKIVGKFLCWEVSIIANKLKKAEALPVDVAVSVKDAVGR